MLKYVPLYTEIWSDPFFKRLPDSDCRLMFIYLFGNGGITLSGIYSIDLEEAQVKLRMGKEQFEKAFKHLTEEPEKTNIYWDAEKEIVWVVNRFKLIPNKSPKIVVGLIDELNLIKHPFKEKFLERYLDDIKDYHWRMRTNKPRRQEEPAPEPIELTDKFLIDASKIYNGKRSLKGFMMNRGFTEHDVDIAIERVLPHLKS